MSLIVADCPRCGSHQITFDLIKDSLFDVKFDWQNWYEAFCVCRNCKRATIFVLCQANSSDKELFNEIGLVQMDDTVNRYVTIEGFINLADLASTSPPEHLPKCIEAVFKEGAKCMVVGCYNAAGTMFRLCLDLATLGKLPDGETKGLNYKVRRDLGLRLPWLFDNGLLPEALRDISQCVKEDGNDGAHAGTLVDTDAEDLLDFTVALLERIYTEPERLRLARERRSSRRRTSVST